MLKWYLAESADILQKYYCDQQTDLISAALFKIDL